MTLSGIIWVLVIGLVIGLLARLITPGPNPRGIIVTIVIGIVGAVIGGFLAQMLHIGGQANPSAPFNLYTFLIAFVGACILLAILKFVNRRA